MIVDSYFFEAVSPVVVIDAPYTPAAVRGSVTVNTFEFCGAIGSFRTATVGFESILGNPFTIIQEQVHLSLVACKNGKRFLPRSLVMSPPIEFNECIGARTLHACFTRQLIVCHKRCQQACYFVAAEYRCCRWVGTTGELTHL